MNTPLVSILIPTYNQQKYICKCIESAINQDYPNIEVIVSDDCSTDKTQKKIERFNSNIHFKYFRNTQNIGRVKNYQKLLYEYASGEWVVMLDGDDYFHDPTFISTCIDIIIKNPDLVFIQGGFQFIFEEKNKTRQKLPQINKNSEFVKKGEYLFEFLRINHFKHSATIYKKDKALQVGFYQEDILSSDIESFMKLSFEGDVMLVKKIFSVWRIHSQNQSGSNNIDEQITNLLWINRIEKYAQEKLIGQQKHNIHKCINKIYKKKLAFVFYDYAKKIPPQKANTSLYELLKYYLKQHKTLFFYPKFLLLILLSVFKVNIKKL